MQKDLAKLQTVSDLTESSKSPKTVAKSNKQQSGLYPLAIILWVIMMKGREKQPRCFSKENMGKINVENMDLYYGQFHALKNINLDIPEKKITAFIGPSGCGKSTLLKSLNRMNDLVEGCKITGDIRLDGEDIYGNIDVNLLRKRVGMVFQKPNPFPMSIYDNVAYGPRTHGIHSKEKLDDIVERALRNGIYLG